MAASNRPELRDLEILRALLRVRYLTTRQITWAFFTCPRVGRRRVHRLSEYDLIRPHAKGLPEALRYTAWRLTARGLDAVAHEFPDEPVPDGLIDRVATGSLHHALHREALAELYLGLAIPPRTELADSDLAAHRRWVGEMRARAGSITWQPDGDVVLSVSQLGQRVDVVPDAVVRSRAQWRVFIELDRSTKDLGRIREGLERYQSVLRHHDFGGDAPCVLFVVRSAARKANIQKLTAGLPLVVVEHSQAVAWLREQLLAILPAASTTDRTPMHTAAHRAYSWMVKLDRVLRMNGMHAALSEAEPDLMKQGVERMTALYHRLKASP